MPASAGRSTRCHGRGRCAVRYPATIAYSDAGINGFIPYGNLSVGIPPARRTRTSSGNIPLPRGVQMNWPDPDNSERGTIDSWNVFVERRLPMDLAVSAGYVGTATRERLR